MFNHEETSNTITPSRRYDLNMSRRTRKPKIFSDEEELGKEEDDLQASLHRSSLIELLTTENGSRRKVEEEILKSEGLKSEDEKEDDVGEMERFDREDIGEEKRSKLAIVRRKGSIVGKYLKVLKHLIKAKGDLVKRRIVMK